MELSIYDVIVGPIISDKAYKLSSRYQKVMLQVHPMANKPMVSQAIETLFDVKVDNVRILVRKGKFKRTKVRTVSQDNLRKHAIITLKPGYNINLFAEIAPQQGMQNQQEKPEQASS